MGIHKSVDAAPAICYRFVALPVQVKRCILTLMEENTPPLFTPQAQWTCAALVVCLLLLTAWYSWGKTRFSTRPLTLRHGLIHPFDLNTSDADRLAAIPGLGPALARRIVDHREKHGPFRSIDGLLEVPGIGPLTLERIRPSLILREAVREPAPVVRASGGLPFSDAKPVPDEPLDPNTAPEEMLQLLPGIGPVLAARIVDERKRQPYVSVDDLRRVRGIGEKTLDKMRPYLRLASTEASQPPQTPK
jgi:competence protein ComEA